MVSGSIIALDCIAVVGAVCLDILFHYSKTLVQVLVGLEVLQLSLGAVLGLFGKSSILVIFIGVEVIQLAVGVEALLYKLACCIILVGMGLSYRFCVVV